jgi:hypothetical protein
MKTCNAERPARALAMVNTQSDCSIKKGDLYGFNLYVGL